MVQRNFFVIRKQLSLSAFILFTLVLHSMVDLTSNCKSYGQQNDTKLEISQTVPSIATRKNGDDWNRMMGPQGNGYSSEKNILKDWNKGNLKVKWTAKVGTGYSPGVTSRGRCFQFDRYRDTERLTCHNAETGDVIWTWESPVEYQDMYGYNNGPRTSPVVDEDRVYVLGVAGTLAAINVTDGTLLWKLDTNEKFGVIQNFFGVGSSPIVHNDLLIVMIGGSPPESASIPVGRLDGVKPNGTAFVAFNKYNGKEVYRVGNYLASYSSPVIAKLHGRHWCMSLVREGFLMFDPDDGSKEVFYPWRASILESVNAAWPVVLPENRIFISETYEIGSAVLEFDGKKLNPVWTDKDTAKKQRAFRAHWATPIYLDGYIFGCSGRNEPDADYRCISVNNGELKWTNRTRDRSTSLLIDKHLVVLSEHGNLQLVNPTSSKFDLITEMDLGNTFADDGRAFIESPSWAPPVVSHGLLYVRGRNRIVCLDLIPE